MRVVARDKAAHDEVNERIRAALRQEMTARGWVQVHAAKALQVSQQTLSDFLAAKTGASLLLALSIAKLVRAPLHELATGEPDVSAGVRFSTLPGWEMHEAAARQANSFVPSQAFDAVSGWRGDSPPAVVTPSVVAGLAEVWWKASLSAAKTPPTDDDQAESHTRHKRFAG